jgi:hypothetical protein
MVGFHGSPVMLLSDDCEIAEEQLQRSESIFVK